MDIRLGVEMSNNCQSEEYIELQSGDAVLISS